MIEEDPAKPRDFRGTNLDSMLESFLCLLRSDLDPQVSDITLP